MSKKPDKWQTVKRLILIGVHSTPFCPNTNYSIPSDENLNRQSPKRLSAGSIHVINANMLHLACLTLTTLWANSADDKLMICYLFSQKTGLEIHANCLARSVQKDWIRKQRTHSYCGSEIGSLGFIETLHKQKWSLQQCLRPLTYTWAELYFQIYHS